MRYYIDTEFSERPCTIDLISLAIVAEDGRELYCVSSEFDAAACNTWVQANVLPNLHTLVPFGVMTRREIREQVLEFVGDDASPEFWGYYADYDWVAFCWLFGAMVDLPKGWPMFCRDLKQLAGDRKLPHSNDLHNALMDARDIKRNHEALIREEKTDAS